MRGSKPWSCLDRSRIKGSSHIGILEDGLTIGTNGMTGWDVDGWVGAGCFHVDGEIAVRYCREKVKVLMS